MLVPSSQLGELYEHLGRAKDALTAYRRGHAFRRAVDLARREFPASVIDIEEEWGDWLAAQKQNDAVSGAPGSGSALSHTFHMCRLLGS